jgi:hypothetical protein
LIQIIIGFLMYKYYNGRRITINFILVLICVPIELAQFFVQAFVTSGDNDFSKDGKYTANFYLNCLQGIFVYTLFYQVCILGPIDMAKVWMLRSNTKVIGIFFCVLFGFTNAIQAVGLELLIKAFVTTNKDVQESGGGIYLLIIQDSFEMLANIVALMAIWHI